MLRKGQSILEVLVAIGLGAIFIIGAATIIAPSLLISKQTGLAQTKTELVTELLNNVKTWAGGNWNGVLALATSSANTYYLNTSSSPFTAVAGTQTVFLGAVSSTRYFYLSDVYRDSGGNVTSTTGGNSYDPSTKQITVMSNGTRNGAPTSTVVAYLTRNASNVFDQTDWSGGSGFSGPTTAVTNTFSSSANMNSTTTPGSLQASGSGGGGGGSSGSYSYYRTITVTSSQAAASGTLTNFPMLVSSTLSSWASSGHGGKVQNLVTAPNGGQEPADLVFATSSANCGTANLNFETESYNSSTGALVDWVNVPTMATNTVIYVCYDSNSVSTDQSHPSSTWDSNYAAVYHLPSGTILNASDSTSNVNNATSINGTTATSSGLIDGGANFDNSTNFIGVANSSSLNSTSSITVSTWIRKTGDTSHQERLLHKENAAPSTFSLFQNDSGGGGDNAIYFYLNGAQNAKSTNTTWTAGTWYYITATYDSSNIVVYVNGLAQGTTAYSTAINTNTGDLTIGGATGGTTLFDGVMDEVRVSKIARSSQWILTEYSNQSNPATFYTLGAETAGSSAGTINSSTSLHWAWNDAIGWIDFYNSNNVTVGSTGLTGYASSSAGDVSLDCATSHIGNICSNGSSSGYLYYRTITVTSSPSAASGTQTNFPMLVSSTFSSWATSAHGGNVQNLVTAPNGGKEPADLVFATSTANCGTANLNFETESYNSSTGALVDWVNVPTMATNTVVYVCYDKSSVNTDQSHPSSTWDANYKGVWHMADNAGNTTVIDSTSNANTGTAAASTNGLTTAGKFGSALTFNGSSDYIYTANSIASPSVETVQVWFKTSSTAGTKLIGFEDAQSGTTGASYDRQIWVGTDGKVYGGFYSADYPGLLGSASTYNDNNWHLADLVYDGSAQQDRLYVDGSQVGNTISDVSGPQGFTGYYRIGSYKLNTWSVSNDGYFNGTLQEARVSLIARSPSWILTEYSNQSNPATFYTVGAETSLGNPYQVLNDGSGNLSGWAWNDEYGWISFCGGQSTTNCPGSTTYRVTIDGSGNFQGWAWNDDVGWIDFNCDNNSSCGTSNFEVQTTWTAGSVSSTATLDSAIFDTGVASGAQLNSIGWQGNYSSGSTVQFQIAVSNSSGGPWNYAGTDGTSNTYFTPTGPGTPVSLGYTAFNGYRYFRYRVAITYANSTSSRVDDVIVNWSP